MNRRASLQLVSWNFSFNIGFGIPKNKEKMIYVIIANSAKGVSLQVENRILKTSVNEK